MPLTILSIAFPFAPVGANAVGGAEQVMSDLDSALVALGHRSIVVACEGSQPAGPLYDFPLPDREQLTPDDQAECRRQVQCAIDRALREYSVDLVHMHGLDFDRYEIPTSVPVLVTLHLPIAWYSPGVWSRQGPHARFCCVSRSQRAAAPLPLASAPVIENGVELALFYTAPKENFALTLGRICPEKNAHAALQAGTLAHTPVLLGGCIFPYPEHQTYFRQQVEPLLHAPTGKAQHGFLGPVAPAQKRDLLARAKCLLHPTLAPETSSLVAMEALASGTPVIAYPSGALPEIVEHGVTGFLVDGVREMADAISRCDAISPEACRRAAQRFSKLRMVREYLALYRRMTRSAVAEHAHA